MSKEPEPKQRMLGEWMAEQQGTSVEEIAQREAAAAEAEAGRTEEGDQRTSFQEHWDKVFPNRRR